VTQYKCGDEDNGGKRLVDFLSTHITMTFLGPDGCLQYFREPTGVVSR